MKAKKDDITHKLKIARGQIDGILQMIEEDRYCVDISTQLQSVQALLKSSKSTDSTGTYPKLCPGGFANRCRKSEAGGSPETT